MFSTYLCILYKNCGDGFCSSWKSWRIRRCTCSLYKYIVGTGSEKMYVLSLSLSIYKYCRDGFYSSGKSWRRRRCMFSTQINYSLILKYTGKGNSKAIFNKCFVLGVKHIKLIYLSIVYFAKCKLKKRKMIFGEKFYE